MWKEGRMIPRCLAVLEPLIPNIITVEGAHYFPYITTRCLCDEALLYDTVGSECNKYIHGVRTIGSKFRQI